MDFHDPDRSLSGDIVAQGHHINLPVAEIGRPARPQVGVCHTLQPQQVELLFRIRYDRFQRQASKGAGLRQDCLLYTSDAADERG